MVKVVGALGAVLFGMGFLLLGNGLFGTLTALRMTHENFSAAAIGIVIAAHSIGFAAACLTSTRLIEAVGHIRVFAGFAAVLSVCCLCFPVAVDPIAWIILRLIFGYATAAVFMVGESWLAGAAPADGKGKIFAVYMIVNKGGFGVGQLLIMLGEPSSDRMFMLAAALYAICLMPIALARIKAPEGIGSEPLGLGALYRLSPVGVVGAVGAGATNSSLLGLGPVFADGLGMTLTQVSFFMAIFLAGSLVLQIPIGRLSDRFDRRTVLFSVTLITAAACVGMAFTTTSGHMTLATLLMLSALVGGLSATIYPIAMTHANDHAKPEQTVALHAGLLLFFAIGASIGPIAASLTMEAIGPGGLFAFGACVYVMLALFTVFRMTRRAPLPEDQQTDFVAMPQTSMTSPNVAGLDPRNEDRMEEEI
jgi:MFS family permease